MFSVKTKCCFLHLQCIRCKGEVGRVMDDRCVNPAVYLIYYPFGVLKYKPKAIFQTLL